MCLVVDEYFTIAGFEIRKGADLVFIQSSCHIMSYNCFIIVKYLSYSFTFYNLILQEIAKRIRPNTIRAHFGKTKVENAVHVTDLPEDSVLEVQLFLF